MVSEIEAYLSEQDEPDFDVEEILEYEPFDAVPDSRFHQAIPQLDAQAQRLFQCQLGVTGGGAATVYFSARTIDEYRGVVPILMCQQDGERRAAFCEYSEEETFYFGEADNFVRFDDSLDPKLVQTVLTALYNGRATNVIRDWENSGWPDDWFKNLQGAYFGKEILTDVVPKRYDLTFNGCGCRTSVVFAHGLELDPANPVVEEISGFCI